MDTTRSSSALKTDKKRSIMSLRRSPSRFTRPFSRGKYLCARYYYRPREENLSRLPSYSLRLNRFQRASSLRLPSRSRSPSVVLRRKHVHSSNQHLEKRSEKNSSTPVQYKKTFNATDRSRSSSVASERLGLSFTVNQEEQITHGKESSVTRAAARSRAIQKKREEIEEVYRQDCDTFGVVVKMLVAKDPSLEKPIQSSLRENLREIGLRCVEAMDQFIQDYDSRDRLGTPYQSQCH